MEQRSNTDQVLWCPSKNHLQFAATQTDLLTRLAQGFRGRSVCMPSSEGLPLVREREGRTHLLLLEYS